MRIIELDFSSACTVIFHFNCSKCLTQISRTEIVISDILYASQADYDGEPYLSDILICDECGMEYKYQALLVDEGGELHIDGLENTHEVHVEETYISDEEISIILSNTDYYNSFKDGMIKTLSLYEALVKNNPNLNSLLDDEPPIEGTLEISLRNLLYTNVITCLETFLSSAFMNMVTNEEKYFRNFIETFQEFKTRKFDFSNYYTVKERINEIAKEEMIKVLYHNLSKVRGMYKDTLGIIFPPSDSIYKAILKRHDIVHRNGRTKDNEAVEISNDELYQLYNDVYEFVEDIELQIKNLNLKNRFPNNYK